MFFSLSCFSHGAKSRNKRAEPDRTRSYRRKTKRRTRQTQGFHIFPWSSFVERNIIPDGPTLLGRGESKGAGVPAFVMNDADTNNGLTFCISLLFNFARQTRYIGRRFSAFGHQPFFSHSTTTSVSTDLPDRTGPDRNPDGFKTFTRNALQWEEGTGRKWQGFSASCSFWKARVECTTRDDGGCVVPRNDDGRAVPRHLLWTCFALAREGRERGRKRFTDWVATGPTLVVW